MCEPWKPLNCYLKSERMKEFEMLVEIKANEKSVEVFVPELAEVCALLIVEVSGV